MGRLRAVGGAPAQGDKQEGHADQERGQGDRKVTLEDLLSM